MALSIVGTVTDATNLNGGFSVAVQANYAYVTAQLAHRLTVVDVSTPSAPTVVGSVLDATNLEGARGVAVDGNYAYVASWSGARLTVVNISTPTAPAFVSTLTGIAGACGVVKVGNYVYVAKTNGSGSVAGLAVVDVSNPATPTLAASLIHGDLTGAYMLAVYGSYLVVVGSTKTTVVNISTPTAPTVAGSVADGATASTNGRGVAIRGSTAVVASYADDLVALIDLSTPSAPAVVASITSVSRLDGAWGVLISGIYAFVTASIDAGVSVWNVSDPATFTLADEVGWIASTLSLDGVRGFDVYDTYLVCAGADQVGIVDASDFISAVVTRPRLRGGQITTNPLRGGQWQPLRLRGGQTNY